VKVVVAAVATMPAAPRQAEGRELDDLTLARARRGERAACTRFVSFYERRVFAVLARILGPAGRDQVVEDLAQETFLRALRALPKFDVAGPARVSTWLLTIATRRALSELARRSMDTEELPLDAPARRSDDPERVHTRRALQQAIADLTPEQRAVFVLRDAHGLTEAEVAQALELDPAAVKSRLHRARARLRKLLTSTENDHV
jgi:RNA polymerase sigma-70 factor (ECF subfamily)